MKDQIIPGVHEDVLRMNSILAELKEDDINKKCCFCQRSDIDEFKYGKFYSYDTICVHYFCLLFSSALKQNGKDEEGIQGFLVNDILEEINRTSSMVCMFCNGNRASVICYTIRCTATYHFSCGYDNGALFKYFGRYTSNCRNHRKLQKIDVSSLSVIEDMVCCICRNSITNKPSYDVIWSPCCKKGSWFHRDCIQHMALNHGSYFFKCPLCNDSKTFKRTMLNSGIYVPDTDASWEKEPRAFADLLQVYMNCDADNCKCPNGRSYSRPCSSSKTMWDIIRCNLCGSQGVHRYCSQLNFSNEEWDNFVWNCAVCSFGKQTGNLIEGSQLPMEQLNSETGNLIEGSQLPLEKLNSEAGHLIEGSSRQSCENIKNSSSSQKFVSFENAPFNSEKRKLSYYSRNFKRTSIGRVKKFKLTNNNGESGILSLPPAYVLLKKFDELHANIDELNRLSTLCNRQKVKDILADSVKKVEAEIESARKDIEIRAAVSKPTSYTKLNRYAWDQTDDYVEIYVTMSGIQKDMKLDLQCTFGPKEFNMLIRDLNGKNFQLSVGHLLNEINTDDRSFCKLKKNMVVIYLSKCTPGKWEYLTSTDQKQQEKKVPKFNEDKNEDPGTSMMKMMQQLYEEGDDDMKRTISKAWTESRQKQSQFM